MHQDAPAHQKHGSSARDGKAFHEPRGRSQYARAQCSRHAAGFAAQPQTQIVELDDAPHKAIDTDGHDDRVVRFCFAKQESTLAAAGERLRQL